MAEQVPTKEKFPRFQVFHDPAQHPTRVWIFDDEFHWDAGLRVTGDFAEIADRIRFAQAICDVLNEAADRIPNK